MDLFFPKENTQFMAKISELSDKQLVTQLEKYEKIYFQLLNERDKRLEKSGPDPKMYTKREIDLRQIIEPDEKEDEGIRDERTQAFQLKFEDSEIAQMHEAEKAIEVQSESEEDEVRVTQLLRLSKEQLAELKAGSSVNKKVVKKKVMKKKVKKK